MPNPEQQRAIDAEGRVFLSAGAGTGKTAVLVERFARAVCERGLDVGSMLVITYTRKAAGELRARIRRELRARGRTDLARELDGAWIATIHGFCARLLRTYPFEAGPRPALPRARRGAVVGARRRGVRAALEEFCAGEDPARLQLLATYGTRGCDACSAGSTRRSARRGGRSCSSWASERRSPSGSRRCARPRAASPTTRRDRARSARTRRGCSRCSTRRTRIGCSTSPRTRRRACARDVRGGAGGRRAGRARRARAARPRPPAGAARGVRPRVRRREAPRGRARLRGPPARRARPVADATRRSASASTCASRRSWSTSSRTRIGSSAT